MLNSLCTIQGKNGEIMQGKIEWICHETFWFHNGINIFWGKTDYWKIISEGVRFYNIKS